MNDIQDTLLVLTRSDTKNIICQAIKKIPGLDMIEADSEKNVLKLIYTHSFAMIIVDHSVLDIDIPEICAMLNSHKKIHNAPLLVLTMPNKSDNCSRNNFMPNKILTDYKDLYIDFLTPPFDVLLFEAKIKLFYEFYKRKTALNQSVGELDIAYQKMIEQHDTAIKEKFFEKKSTVAISITAEQMQQPVRGLWAGINLLQKDKVITQKSRTAVSTIKNCTQQLEQLSKKSTTLVKRTKQWSLDTNSTYHILYIEASHEDFNIFKHLAKTVLPCQLTRATTIKQGMSIIAGKKFDLIFVSQLLPDGTGLHFLSRLRQLRSDIPVVLTLNRGYEREGPKAISKGAFSYFIKEEFCAQTLSSTIADTFAKTKIIQAADDARERIVLVSQKDALTRLFNRRRFEKELAVEMTKTKRYHTPLSIIIVHFNTLNEIEKAHGHAVMDQVLITSATVIQGMSRNNDIICRFSQKRFGILLPHTDANGAKLISKRIEERIIKHGFDQKTANLEPSVTITTATCDPKKDPDDFHQKDFSLIKQAMEIE